MTCSYKVALLLYLTRVIMATPTIDHDKKTFKFEEYIVEHDISEVEAKKSALEGDLNTLLVPAGCQNCTKEDIRYCKGSDVISDHCCCDKRFRGKQKYGYNQAGAKSNLASLLVILTATVNMIV